MRAAVLVIVMAACSGSKGSGAPTPTAGARDDAAGGTAETLADARAEPPADAMVMPPIDAMPAPPADAMTAPPAAAGDLRCKSDPAARRDCAARGKTYRYGTGSMVQCGGAPLPPDLLRQREAAQRKEPCVCLEVAEIERRGRACMEVP